MTWGWSPLLESAQLQAAGAAYSLTCAVGTFVETGNAATLNRGRYLACAVRSFAIAGDTINTALYDSYGITVAVSATGGGVRCVLHAVHRRQQPVHHRSVRRLCRRVGVGDWFVTPVSPPGNVKTRSSGARNGR